MMRCFSLVTVFFVLSVGIVTHVAAASANEKIGEMSGSNADASPAIENYRINPGDVLSVNVWNEESFSIKEALVRPDGYVGIPVVGEVLVAGKTIEQTKQDISTKLLAFLKDKPVVAVSTLSLSGNAVFVLGKVARPGQFTLYGRMDVTMVLALAGGLTTFAKANDIKVLRRDERGAQFAIPVNYGKIESGDRLEDNILIKSGDVVIVP